MNKKEATKLQNLLTWFEFNLELVFNQEDMKEIEKSKKDFHRNEIKALEKYISKIRTQSLKSNLL